jgi:hypothetical protein
MIPKIVILFSWLSHLNSRTHMSNVAQISQLDLVRTNQNNGMAAARTESLPLVLALVATYLPATAVAFAEDSGVARNFESCRAIPDDQIRLDCFKKLLPRTSTDPAGAPTEGTSVQSSWPLIRTPHPQGGRDSVAIMRTADTARSDADLAGLMIRCEEKPGFQVLLALVRPLPPRAKRDVLVTSGTTQSLLHAEVSPAGTALILPIDATAFTIGPWQGLKELGVTIRDPETEIRGVIPLEGVAPAMARLSANCQS